MQPIAFVRGLGTAAAVGGGSLGLGTALLLTEAKLARRCVGIPESAPPACDGVYGFCPGAPISFAVLGDSSAVGFGVDDPAQTPGALIAAGVAAVAERPVRVTCTAGVGAVSADLGSQVDAALIARPHVALIMVGANDVTHRVLPATAVGHLATAVQRLRAAGCEVVVGTCPDLGTIEPIAQPLRWIARRWSRTLAALQTVAVVEAGGRTVSLADVMGPEFAAAPHEMFSPDRFHPSAVGYAAASMAVLPSVCAALGYWPTETVESDPAGADLRSVARAAAAAVEDAGAEVAPAESRSRAPWALLRRRGEPAPHERAASSAA